MSSHLKYKYVVIAMVVVVITLLFSNQTAA